MWTTSRSVSREEYFLVDAHTGALRPEADAVIRAAPSRPDDQIDLLSRLRPVLERRAEWSEVEDLTESVLAGGNGARRQRRAHDETGGFPGVVDMLVRATTA